MGVPYPALKVVSVLDLESRYLHDVVQLVVEEPRLLESQMAVVVCHRDEIRLHCLGHSSDWQLG